MASPDNPRERKLEGQELRDYIARRFPNPAPPVETSPDPAPPVETSPDTSRAFGEFVLENLRTYSCVGFGTKKRSRNIKIESMFDPKGKPVFAVYRPVGGSCPSDCLA